jgi:hypothetical protein
MTIWIGKRSRRQTQPQELRTIAQDLAHPLGFRQLGE